MANEFFDSDEIETFDTRNEEVEISETRLNEHGFYKMPRVEFSQKMKDEFLKLRFNASTFQNMILAIQSENSNYPALNNWLVSNDVVLDKASDKHVLLAYLWENSSLIDVVEDDTSTGYVKMRDAFLAKFDDDTLGFIHVDIGDEIPLLTLEDVKKAEEIWDIFGLQQKFVKSGLKTRCK